MNISRTGRITLGATLALWLTGCGKDPDEGPKEPPLSVCEQRAPQLQSALEEAVSAEELAGVTAAVRFQDCTWQGAAGKSRMEPATAMTAEDRLRAGSLTKTFVSVVALQLQAEGKLSLEAKLATYLPSFPRADSITVRQLLNHTSGAANYTRDPGFIAQAMANPGKVWTPDELIAWGAARSPAFEPGTRHEYSNTNFILAGLVIEKVTGTSLAWQLRTRIIEPLGLRSTGLDGAEPVPPLTVHGYMRTPNNGPWTDVSGLLHPSSAGAAGALVSNAEELSRFYQALFDGSLLTPAQLEEMTRWVPTQDPENPGYGLALMRFATTVWPGQGHTGSILGFSSVAISFPEQKATLVVLTNREGANRMGVARRLLEVLAAP